MLRLIKSKLDESTSKNMILAVIDLELAKLSYDKKDHDQASVYFRKSYERLLHEICNVTIKCEPQKRYIRNIGKIS